MPAPARGQPPDVRALAIALLEALLGRVSVLVVPVVVLLGDAEVDERAIPEVAERHGVSVDRSVLKEQRSDPDVGRALLGRDAEVLRRAHRELERGRARRRARAAARTTGATPPGSRRRRHRRQAADAVAEVAGDLGRRDPDLRRLRRRGSPGRAPGSRAGARPSASRASGRARRGRLTTFTLFDWRWPMKCQRNASPYTACFASRSCARFSPTTSMPASTSSAMSASETYFVAATTVTPGPTPRCTRCVALADLRRRQQPITPCAPCGRRRGGARRRAPGCSACTGRGARRARRPPRRRRRSAAAPEIEDPAAGQVGVEARRHLGADLVAARPDRTARRRRRPSSSAPPSARRPPRRPPRRDRASPRAAPRAAARPGARRAIGTQSAASASSGRPGSSVQRPSPSSRARPASARLHRSPSAPGG